ncbi:alpha/beta fold hydrolase [Microbacterium memoriense]|uniref:Alpha/beta hydrolase n=1 Tax=Microbacterium memoriense TaxID=2978350 RepID=A0ABT2PBS0_9MICO|nr:alpha/beta hydrolase [Microbacterium memoriense]MCT9002059.1 alpha/beta hydrolase [Microbacterium memoriense]
MNSSTEALTTLTFATSLGRVHARVLGAGPTAILWHGMFVTGSSWNPIVDRLARTRRLIVLDGPGYGSSDELARLTSIEECAEVAAQIITQLPGAGPVDWVGTAWGGHVGMTAGALSPELFRSIVAISSPVQPIDPVFRIKLIIANMMLARFGPIAHLRHAVQDAQLTKSNRQNAAMTSLIDDAMRGTSPKALARTVTSFIINRTDASHRLPRIHAPALLVTGDDRGEWSPDIMAEAAALIPDARTAVIPGARTLVQVEQPAATADAIEAFWDAI